MTKKSNVSLKWVVLSLNTNNPKRPTLYGGYHIVPIHFPYDPSLLSSLYGWRNPLKVIQNQTKVEKLQGGLPRVSRQCKYGLWITKWLINAMIVVVLYQSKYLSILKHRKIDYNCGNWLFKDVQSESSICLCRTQLYTYL